MQGSRGDGIVRLSTRGQSRGGETKKQSFAKRGKSSNRRKTKKRPPRIQSAVAQVRSVEPEIDWDDK